MDYKFIFTILSAVTVVIAFYPYIRDVYLKKTKPHEFTWLIWGITQSVAVAGLWYGGGVLASLL